jgi:hypothetical protein
MSNKKKRRIRPHERARVDQVMAAARDHAIAEPTAAVFVTEYADPGRQCSWCDCTLKQHQDPAYRCAGCPDDAVYLLHEMPERAGSVVYPLCERHRSAVPELSQLLSEALHREIPVNWYGFDAYDGHRA